MDGFGEIKRRIERDYAYLVATLRLDPQAILVVYPSDPMKEFPEHDVGHGYTSHWSLPGYTAARGPVDSPDHVGAMIILPVDPHALDEAQLDDTVPPVTEWDRNWAWWWPNWRLELWHEVCHQYQDQRLGKWNPTDTRLGHIDGWGEAVHKIADAVGCKRGDFYDLMRSPDVPKGDPPPW